MALNIVRIGTAAVVGAASGGLDSDPTRHLDLGDPTKPTVIMYGTILEAVALIGGAAMQLMMPFMAANIADGAVDAGAALLAARGVKQVMTEKPPVSQYMYPSRMAGALSAGNVAPSYSRAAIGNINQAGPRVKLG